MATTLKQYWTDEVARITARLAALDTELNALRGTPTIVGTLGTAQAALADASSDVTAQAKAVDDARKALAAIPMPGDGDPLLVAMEDALIALADARASLADADRDVQARTADLTRLLGQQAALQAALAEATAALARANKDADTRLAWTTALTTGEISTLAADAAAALAASEATARSRVEGEFPSNAAAEKDFLTRARARRALPLSSLAQAVTVETAAVNADAAALAEARRAWDAAVDALRLTVQAAPRLAADTATLQRLAALPAAHPAAPASYPVVTVWQHNRLHDAGKKADRENALAKLKDVEDAAADVRAAQTAYDNALHAALVADPDKTPAELDAGVVKPKKDEVVTKQALLATKRAALSADEIHAVKGWFAAVPDTLWDALDKLDTAAARLKALVGPPAPAALISAMNTAEATLAAALEAARHAARQAAAADLAEQRAAGLLAAELDTAAARSAAREHGATLF
jgi:hypothetical protein